MGWECVQGPDLAPVAEVWEAAFRARPASIFQSFTFARHWAAAFRQEAAVQVWFCRNPPLVAPLVVREDRLGLIGEGLFDYLDLIGEAPARWLYEVAELAQRASWSSAQFTGVPRHSPHGAFWQALGGTSAEYAAAPLRTEGGDVDAEHPRLAARWDAAGVELRLETELAVRRRVLAWLFDRKARALAARGERNVLGANEQRWLAAMAENEPGLTELWSLRRGGEILAALLCWRTAAVRYAYTLSYEQRCAALSPGVLLLYAVVRQTMNQRRAFNFLTGDQAFKLRLATDRDPLLRFSHRRL
ncbi:MAG: GNAT family N-acetyltransferase [Terriglobales bacterium]